ncbi:phospholipase D family protein [Aestuariispira insulae]|uniref:PLD phosphodiesterase domain-containing protein n=1 Tax=Aestuariispira insulae TaxID=1461337 RepID=A0A3D9H680_9PROT|nr:phospholipase D family protein [Aestuariispira insulae]RED45015.1 hypothetical protein DFP90_1126 [Aestuariispira insulae]
MLLPGPELIDLCRNGKKEVILIAPFMKCDAVQMAFDAIPRSVTSVKCVTRWKAEEVLAGVSDLEVFDLIKERNGASLHVQPVLHAKYYRADDACLIGSANLTKRGMGWAMPSNLELLVHLEAKLDRLRAFEALVFSTAIEATDELRSEVAHTVQELEDEGNVYIAEETPTDDSTSSIPPEYWLPLCLRPELLFPIFTETQTDRIVGWTLEAGRRDIGALRIPKHLSAVYFRKYVAALLRQSPVVQALNKIAHKPITPAEGREFIAEHVPEDYRAYGNDQHWETMRNWLLHFLSNEYRQPTGSFDLQRGTEIARYSR